VGAAPLPRLGYLLLLGVTFGWGLNWPFMKIAMLEIPVLTFRGWSCMIAGLILFAVAAGAGLRLRPTAEEWRPLIAATFFNVVWWQLLVGFALLLMGTGRAGLLAFTMPIWGAMLSFLFLGERPTPRVLLALGLGMAGILVLLLRDLAAVGDSPLGIAFTLLAAAGWAAGVLIQKRMAWRMPMTVLAAWQFVLGAGAIIPVAAAVDGVAFLPVSMTAWMSGLYVVLIALVFTHYAWFKVVQLFPANIASIGTLMVPVLIILSGAWVLGEHLGWREVAAVLLICGALALVLIQPRRA